MRAERLLLLMLAVAGRSALAQDIEAPGPSMAFLEFLGGMVEVDQQLVGPEDMAELAVDPGPIPEGTSVEQNWGDWESTVVPGAADEPETEDRT